jgi:hypothetical protein
MQSIILEQNWTKEETESIEIQQQIKLGKALSYYRKLVEWSEPLELSRTS